MEANRRLCLDPYLDLGPVTRTKILREYSKVNLVYGGIPRQNLLGVPQPAEGYSLAKLGLKDPGHRRAPKRSTRGSQTLNDAYVQGLSLRGSGVG